ncbi:hypothetical protein [uncultured Brachyspira sp.]|nr:hypothetical protein [uncultured Brachyspira sp.]
MNSSYYYISLKCHYFFTIEYQYALVKCSMIPPKHLDAVENVVITTGTK